MNADAPDPAELASGPLFSEELGIDLASGGEAAAFRWFLASLLFGARISGALAARTYRAFADRGLTDPKAILAAGWDYLVDPVMREGGYVRYDFSKSRQILDTCRLLQESYEGRVGAIHERAADPRDLERRLEAIRGIGPVTANIFLREMRPFWPKADPDPLPVVVATARALGVALPAERKSLAFARMEAALVRFAHPSGGITPLSPARSRYDRR